MNDWYTCGHYHYFDYSNGRGNHQNYLYRTICIGPFANIEDAKNEISVIEPNVAKTTLVPVCKFVPDFMKQTILSRKVIKSSYIDIFLPNSNGDYNYVKGDKKRGPYYYD